MRRATLLTIVLASTLTIGSFFAPTPAHAANLVIKTTDQGLHKLKVGSGELIFITGTYNDALVYKRSLTVYFHDAKEPDWVHVPIAESREDLEKQWFHISRGETTLEDCAVLQRGAEVLLFVISLDPNKNKFKTTRYRFRESGKDYPDGPWYVFVPEGSKVFSAKKDDSVETILDREIAAFQKN